MTLEEKLVNFEESAILAATEKRTELINSYEKALKKEFTEKKKMLDEKAALKVKASTEELKRKANQMLSTETLNAKRLVNEKSVALTNSLFKDVLEKLLEFKKTEEYFKLLLDQILYAVEFADSLPMSIYIDKSDEALLYKLRNLSNFQVKLSNIDFIGGTRAVIHDKNILIDNSFLTKIDELKEDFNI